MEKFTVIGTSKLGNIVKARWANDYAQRVRKLEFHGHTDIKLVELPEAMDKAAACKWLLASSLIADFDSIERAALEVEIAKREPKVKAEAKPEPTLDDVPLRNDKGHFIKREVRVQMLEALKAEWAKGV